MYLIVIIVRVLLIDLVLSQSHEPTANDLECLNDYDTELTCKLQHETCNKYKIQITNSMCNFTLISCECKLSVSNGFISNHLFNVEVWTEEGVLFTKGFNIDQTIKPKRPNIRSVKQNENGNFLVTWNTHYTRLPFSETLCTELHYRDKGGRHNVSIPVPDQSQTGYELVGRNLQPNSDYIITVRIGSGYNNCSRFSEYSEPYEFSTPQSLENIFMIIIPVSCISLILFIFTIFYCYIRLKRQFWDKLPTPKIESSFKTEIHLLSPLENEFSLIHVENPTLDQFENRPCRTSSTQTNIRKKHHHHQHQSLETHAGPSQRKVPANVAVNHLQTSMSHNIPEKRQSIKLTAASTSSEVERDSGNSKNSSGKSLMTWSNRIYFESASERNGTSRKVHKKLTKSRNVANTDFQQQGSESESGKTLGSCYENENHFRSHSIDSSVIMNQFFTHPLSSSHKSENSFPAIPTDFEYGPCCSFTVSADANQAQSTSVRFGPEISVVPGYQSMERLLDSANQPEEDAPVNRAFISCHNEANLTVTKSDCINNPEDVPVPVCESSTIMPADDGYQCFPGSSGQQENAPAPKIQCGPVLHVSPDIQIDCSYQRV